jgi:type IVB pilus formation R64 PilN family outer membrane protein
MTTSNGLNIKKTTLAVAVGSVALSGCSSTHSEKYNEQKEQAERSMVEFEMARDTVAPKEQPLSRIVNDFYVDIAPMEIIQDHKNDLPSIFHHEFTVYAKDPMKLEDLAAEIYGRTGLSLDFINNEKVVEGTEEVVAQDESYNTTQPYYNSGENDIEEIIYEDERVEEEENTLYIDHNGSLKQLLDFVAIKKGVKWKFDQATNKIFVYKYDTRTFTVVGFGEEIEKTSQITTSMSGDQSSDSGQGSSSTTNEQSISLRAKNNYWESVKTTIDSMVSEKGKVTFNDAQGKIIVTDNDFVLADIDRVIGNLNRDAFKEVTLKVQVVSITMTDDRDLNASLNIQGINDKINLSLGTQLDNLTSNENLISFTDGTTTAFMQIFDSLGNATVENSVDAITLNNMPVPVQLTKNQSYISEITTTEDSDTGDESTEATVDQISEGITMTVTPKAIGQNVLIDYSLNLSTIDAIEEAPGDVKIQLPITSTKNFVQRASLKNGIPRVIATVERKLESNSSKHPFNENLWFIGGSEGVNTKKEVLMVVVTPYITDLK